LYSGVRRAACGVRRQASGVRRAASGLRDFGFLSLQLGLIQNLFLIAKDYLFFHPVTA